MSDEESKEEAKPTKKKAPAKADAAANAEAAIRAAEKAEVTAQKAVEKARVAKEKAEAAAEAEYKAIADEVKAGAAKKPDHTFKRQSEEIFRRAMAEPEFFLEKKDRFPRPILSADEQEKITRKAEMPKNQIPAYVPENILSPEFGGLSNYERGVSKFLEDSKKRLEDMKNDPEVTQKQIKNAENDIAYLKSIHENYYIGMNVFRTAKGGRDKVKAR
ncbi:MAG: hypothetical protein EB830_05185 [Nitrosopumilus sp. H13]|nr:MAG: hypothetical protein EB830_05185 [Nitrosopumilus sp. H13]